MTPKYFRQFLRKAAPIFRQIDELNPSVGTQNTPLSSRYQANVEYPWQARDKDENVTWHAPSNVQWALIEQLRVGEGAKVVRFIELLLERFESIFG
jgi:hypothetical protein